MSEFIPMLAIVGGFWGQVFEYWPFALTVGVTLVFGLVTLVAELVWRRTVPLPAGAMPRIEIPVDPRVIPRLWITRGLTLLRLGCGLGIFVAFLFVSFASNPPGVGEQYGLEQESNFALVVGAGIALGASIVGYWATITLRRRPWQMTKVLGVAAALALFGPLLTTGDPRWFGVGVAVMGLPVVFMVLGVIYTVHGLTSAKAADAAFRRDAEDGVLRGPS